ncbi:MAG: hypothetical protein V1855_03210, partial [bacterium]
MMNFFKMLLGIILLMCGVVHANLVQQVQTLQKTLTSLNGGLSELSKVLGDVGNSLSIIEISRFCGGVFLAPGFKDPASSVIPMLGVYGEFYYLSTRYLLVRMLPSMIEKIAPEALINGVCDRVGVARSNFMQEVKRKNIEVHFSLVINQIDSKQLQYNVIYHPFLKEVLNVASGKTFRENVYMGVFGADGVQQCNASDAMPFGSLQLRDVHYHDGCYSPNNAHIL